LDRIALLITASAAIILFIVTPYDLLERWHALPNWNIFWLFFMFVPIVIAWGHAGAYLVLGVVACELAIFVLKPNLGSRGKKVAAGSVAICVVTYLWLYIGNRYNIH
jgi:hypothetical protein